jgi:trimethylamine---corrinoid protein Co-methyltransferase
MREGRTGQRTRRSRDDGSSARSERSKRYRRLSNPFRPLEIFNDDAVAELHSAALRVLAELGIRVLLPEARRAFAAAGALVDDADQLVRIGPDIVGHALEQAPSSVELTAPVPERGVTVGDRCVCVVPVSGPPNVSDLVRGRRAGTLQDLGDFLRLTQMFEVMHLNGPCVEPQDVPPELRHMEIMLAQFTLSDKVPFVYARGSPQVYDCFEMLRLGRGISEEQFCSRPYCWTNINSNSPRQLDVPMAQGVIDFAKAGQLAIITPFTLAGAMAPITLSGALTLAHAEALAGITLAQITRAGAPVVYGGFTSNVDMKSGSPAFGTPEFIKACFGTGQLARHIGLPWRSSSATASNVADEQATYESAMSLWGAMLGGCNVIVHGAGWLESGLTASFEKFILDVEMLQTMAEVLQPVSASPEEIGFDTIGEVSPGGHFFSTAHTMQRYRDAFYLPLLSDWRNFGQWTEGGSKRAYERATEIWQRLLQAYVAPERDPSATEALKTFVALRREAGGALPVS